jgi:putative FmdB family regulatory protein
VPTYQYVCTECGGQLEAVQKFTDDALTVHDDCGGRLRKVFSPVGIVFKGSGFYRTDSRGSASSGSGTAKAGGDSTSSDSGSKSDSGTKSGGDSAASSSADSSASASPSDKKPATEKKPSSEKVA